MKYLILSDIHGVYQNLVSILKAEEFDNLILLGDILAHGPRNDIPEGYEPKKIIDLLNNLKNKIIAIRGNCDAEVDDMVFSFPLLNLAMLEIEGIKIYLTHGHIYNPSNNLNIDNGYVLFGHTHIKEITKVGNVTYINPGSVGIPKDGSASYIVIRDKELLIKDLHQNILERIELCRN